MNDKRLFFSSYTISLVCDENRNWKSLIFCDTKNAVEDSRSDLQNAGNTAKVVLDEVKSSEKLITNPVGADDDEK